MKETILDTLFLDIRNEHVALGPIIIYLALFVTIGILVGLALGNNNIEPIAENLCNDNNGKLLDFEYDYGEEKFIQINCYKLNELGIFDITRGENEQ